MNGVVVDSYCKKLPQLSNTLFYSTFRLMRKPSSGIDEGQQLE